METYVGIIRTPGDAITLFEACRLGLLPRVCRRLSEKERQNIKSGSVFVWDEREAGMRRWTDGKSWSASRVSGSFLTYREMEGRRTGGNITYGTTARSGRTPDPSGRNSDEGEQVNTDESQEGYRYKPDGLMKQSFSITTSTGQHLHLISYYSKMGQAQPHLKQPTTDISLRHIKPPPGMYPESSVQDSHSMPAVTRAPMIPTGPPNQAPQVAGYVAKSTYFARPQSSQNHLQYGPSPHPPSLPPGYGPPQGSYTGYPAYTSQPQSQTHPGYPPYYQAPPQPQDSPMQPGLPQGYPLPPNHLPPLNRNSTPPADPSRQLHQRTGSQGSYQQQYYPSPRNTYNTLTPQASISSHPSQSNSPSSTPPGQKPDPRLMVAPSPLSQHSLQNLHPGYAHSAASSHRSPSPHRTPPPTNHASQLVPPPQPFPQPSHASSASVQLSASTIPSIGALMNGADEYERTRSRSASKSPGGMESRSEGQGARGLREVSREKVNFGEDRRALNALNKVFRT